MTGDTDIPIPSNEAMDWEAGANAKITLTPNTTLKSDFIFSSVGAVATDVEVSWPTRTVSWRASDMSLKWGMFDISGGDDADGTADR